jgi:hypothetical protein
MLSRPACAEAKAGLQHQWNFHLAPGHVANAGRFIQHLAKGDQHELAHPQFNDGTQAGHRSSNTDADFGSLGNGGEADAVLTELLEHRIALGHCHILTV